MLTPGMSLCSKPLLESWEMDPPSKRVKLTPPSNLHTSAERKREEQRSRSVSPQDAADAVSSVHESRNASGSQGTNASGFRNTHRSSSPRNDDADDLSRMSPQSASDELQSDDRAPSSPESVQSGGPAAVELTCMSGHSKVRLRLGLKIATGLMLALGGGLGSWKLFS